MLVLASHGENVFDEIDQIAQKDDLAYDMPVEDIEVSSYLGKHELSRRANMATMKDIMTRLGWTELGVPSTTMENNPPPGILDTASGWKATVLKERQRILEQRLHHIQQHDSKNEGGNTPKQGIDGVKISISTTKL